MRTTIARTFFAVVAAGALVFGMAGTAMADQGSVEMDPDSDAVSPMNNVRHVGGGTWHYGTDLFSGYSNYYHETRCHGSSAESGPNYVRDHNVSAGMWSIADVERHGIDTIRAYWTNTC